MYIGMMMIAVIDQVHYLLKRKWVVAVEQLNCYTDPKDLQCCDGYTAGEEEEERMLGEVEHVAVVDAEGVDGSRMRCKADYYHHHYRTEMVTGNCCDLIELDYCNMYYYLGVGEGGLKTNGVVVEVEHHLDSCCYKEALHYFQSMGKANCFAAAAAAVDDGRGVGVDNVAGFGNDSEDSDPFSSNLFVGVVF